MDDFLLPISLMKFNADELYSGPLFLLLLVGTRMLLADLHIS